MKVVAAFLLAVLGGNPSLSAKDLKSILASVRAETDNDRIELLLKELKGKDITEIIASGREKLASVPFGGGGVAVAAALAAGGAAAPAAAEQKEEENVEEKEESDDIELPEWTDIVKTATFKELAPYDPDWYFIRAVESVEHDASVDIWSLGVPGYEFLYRVPPS